MTFGQSFKYYRKNMGYTQEEVASRLMVTPQAVSKWEVGNGTPDIQLLIPIANLFGVTVDALLGNTKKTELELAEEVNLINNAWDSGATECGNLGEKYRRHFDLLKSNPDSVTLLRSILQISLTWLSRSFSELDDMKRAEIVCNAEHVAELLRKFPEDYYSTHCMMYEIYQCVGDVASAEKESAYFSASGQYIRDRAIYVNLLKREERSEALPHLRRSIGHAIHWLLFDLKNFVKTDDSHDSNQALQNVILQLKDLSACFRTV